MHAIELENAALRLARTALELDRKGRPKCREAQQVLAAIESVVQSNEPSMIDELLVHGFLRESPRRFAQWVEPRMRTVAAARVTLGTPASEARHFCGESPRHAAQLSSFRIADVPVTHELYGVLDPSRLEVSRRDRAKPVANVTWHDAALFALWMGCRLPTEAEWEHACGAGSSQQWCCDERELPRHAWYSDNARAEQRSVALLEPNELGLFDMHGGVWEWCVDDYDQDFYARASAHDPVNLSASAGSRWRARDAHKVCRGGSIHALAEMCRTRYRFHEPAETWAADLGFRLAA